MTTNTTPLKLHSAGTDKSEVIAAIRHLISEASIAADCLSRSTRIDDREQAEDLRVAIDAYNAIKP